MFKNFFDLLRWSPDEAGGGGGVAVEAAPTSMNDVLDLDNIQAQVNQRASAAEAPAAQPAQGGDNAAARERGDAGTPPAAQAPAQDWTGQALPEAVAAKYGVKTLGELTQRYGASSEEGKRLAGTVREYEGYLQKYASLVEHYRRQGLNPQQAQAAAQQTAQGQAAAAKGYRGFESEEHFRAEYAKDSIGAVSRAVRHDLLQELRGNPKLLQELVAPEIDARLQPIQQSEQQRQQEQVQQAQAAFEKTLNEKWAAFEKADPRFGKGGLLHDKWTEWAKDNINYELEKMMANPNHDPFEAGKRWVLFEAQGALASRINTANEEKLRQVAATAAVARPGSGALAAPAKGDVNSTLAAIEAELAAAGHQPPSGNWKEQMRDLLGEKLRI